jgi:hypothetical protein
MGNYQIVLDTGEFFYVTAESKLDALLIAKQLVEDCEIHYRGEV